LENIWKGPYVVVNKQEEWHYYMLEKDGKHRRATANQLRPYYKNEVESDIRFGYTRNISENEDDSDVQLPLPDAESAIEQIEPENGSEAENGVQLPISPRVIVQEMTSSEDSENDESPEVRTRRKAAKLRNFITENMKEASGWLGV
jgi:hypothetical protein